MTFARKALTVLVFSFALLAPAVSFAAVSDVGSPGWHIISAACECPGRAPDFGCVLQTTQNVMNFAVYISFIVMTLAIALAGILWIFTPISASQKEMAKSALMNTVIGIVIVLAAWLIVDFVMKTLYGTQNAWGPWNEIIKSNGNDMCIKETTPSTSPATGTQNGGGVAVTPNPGGGTSTGTGANCPAADPSAMVAFPASATQGDAEKATSATVQNFLAMRAAALQAGIDLKVTDGYRSDAEQVSIWNSRNCSVTGCNGTVAKPCSLGGSGSNHNSGQAIDINDGCTDGVSGCNTPAYNWLVAHGAQWNFRNALPNDRLHWSPTGH